MNRNPWRNLFNRLQRLGTGANAVVPSGPESLSIRPIIVAGAGMLLLFFGVFGGWAALAPLESAVIAQGVVKVAGERKIVQHLEGGIVAELKARDGSIVKANDILISLDDTRARAQLELLKARRLAREAMAARLRAERDSTEMVAFPEWIREEKSESAREVRQTQQDIFQARRSAVEVETAILRQRILQTEDEIVGVEALIAAQDRLDVTLETEASELEALLKKGHATRERPMALRRRQAEIAGERAAHVADLARARKSVVEVEQQILQLSTKMLNESVAELSKVETELFDIEQQIAAAEDIMRRLDIRAPADGVVVASEVHAVGTVIQPGQPLLYIVPVNEDLVLEVRIRPEDIDLVSPGQAARVRVSAFDRFDLPDLDGFVDLVSADRFVDDKTGLSYFSATVRVVDDALTKKHTLMPGMAGEVIVSTGARTMVDYLAEPLTRNLRRALREN